MTYIAYATQHCDDCKKLCDVDTLTTYNIASDGYGLLLRSFCDKCLSKYPKSDPRDWRREDHPDAFGIITWYDGTKSFKGENGELHDVLPESESIIKCTKCSWTGLGENLVCVDWAPDGRTDVCPVCGSTDIVELEAENALDVYDEEEEFVPSLENFLTDVPNHLVAALCLLIIVLSGAGLLILLASKAVAK